MGLIADAMDRTVAALERRFRPGSYNPGLYGFWGGGSRSASGAYVNDSTALSIGAVFACVRLISGTLASLPLITYERLEPRGKRRAGDYFAYALLHDRFNDEQTSMEAREMLQAHLLLRGNAYVAIERDGFGVPQRLVPLHPDHVTPRRLPTGELIYEWRPVDGRPAQIFRQDQHQIMHLRSFIGRDGVTGMSVVEMARESFGMALALEEYGARMFSHGASFTGMLKHPGRLKADKLESLRRDFAEKYSGIENAFKPLILEEGMDWVSIGMKAQDAEFLASRKFQVADIARWFLVPPHMIGDVERSTSWGTGLEQQMQGFLNFTMGYWLKLWEQGIHRDVIPPEHAGRYFVEFLCEGLLRGDSAARADFYTRMLNLGVFSQNDVLDKENMNPFEGGDRHWMPLNMISISPSEPERAATGRQQRRAAKSSRRPRIRRRYAPLLRDMARSIIETEVAGLREILGRRAATDWADLIAGFYKQFPEAAVRIAAPVIRAYAEALAEAASDEVGVPAEIDERMDSFIRSYVDAYVERHLSYSQKRLAQAAGQDDPAAAIDAELEDWLERRPDYDADNELVKMDGAISRFVWQAAGIAYLLWVAGDEACEICAGLNGKVVGIAEPFGEAGDELENDMTVKRPFRHPPAHRGCRCSIEPAM